MSEELLGKPVDPKFPDYAYAARALVKVFENRSGDKVIANLIQTPEDRRILIDTVGVGTLLNN